MGHQRIGTLPDTAPWRRVIAVVADAADAPAVAAATTRAALAGLGRARHDEGVAHCVFLLARLARAGRGDGDLGAALADAGLDAPDRPTVFDVAAAFAEAADLHLARPGRRTDLGEMAVLAAIEALTARLAERAADLFAGAADAARRAARDLARPAGFAALAHDFFARFTHRFLGYHLGRELSLHVGGNGRFADPDEHNHFLDRLGTHCREAAAVMRDFAADWFDKALSPAGDGLTPDTAGAFAAHVLTKLHGELEERGARHG